MPTTPEERFELEAEAPELDEQLKDYDERSLADELIDDLLPPELDWRRLVRRYPVPALLVAAVGGYLLGRSRGPAIVEAVAELATAQISERVGAFAGEDPS